ncbi:MAG: beta-lactamase family protein [Clostridia bacterium]|nr:beta-lactamase family protein [Clostridia bacterium]
MKNELSRTKKIIIAILTPIITIFLAFMILCFVTMGMYSPTFLGRVLTHWDSSVTDYIIFPERIIEKSEQPYSYVKNINANIENITVRYSDKQKSLREFVKSTDTTSFIVVKNDEIVYEQYANGYSENSVNTSFSMAKSVVSLLIGKAVEDGYIKSVTQPISDYISEFKDSEIGKITIEDLLLMRSDIAYNEDKFLWFGDDTLTYWHPDLRQLALSHTQLTDAYKGNFHYNNYHPLLLGIILERSTGVRVSEYFGREIWRKIGADYNASWSLDSEKSGFEKMESGINFRAVDFIKIGSMVLHAGYWNGTQVINGEWLKNSTLCLFPLNNSEYKNSFLEGKNIGYKYMWYSTPSARSGYDIIAWGKSDQIMYISPANDMVILRTGKSDGGVSDWVETIKEIITNI